MMRQITMTFDEVHVRVLQNVLTKRAAELDRYLIREGEALDAVEHQLAKDVRTQVGECLTIVEAAAIGASA